MAGGPVTREPTKRFGAGAIATPANALSFSRILIAPFLFGAIVAWGPKWWLLGAWVVISLSDSLDGWIARRQGATRSGAFLDPLADKVIVIAAMAALIAQREIWWVPALLIVAREVAMSAYRTKAGRRGISIPARKSAKAKTALQDLAIGSGLLPSIAHPYPGIVEGLIWAAAAWTLFTGAQYYLDARHASVAVTKADMRNHRCA
jgi:CDP-diacylglycerol--glycerol-3-phosphate 3-phosphatidyltransferase